MTQQALTIAVSSTGLPKLFGALVVSGDSFAAQLNQEQPSDQNLNIGDVAGNNCFNYVLSLASGAFSGATAIMNSVVQTATGQPDFTLSFDVNTTVNYGDWSETYTRYISGHHGGPGVNDNEGPTDCGPVSFSAQGVTLTATIQIAQSGPGAPWALSYVSATSDSTAANIDINYPGDSILNYVTNENCHGDDLIKSSLVTAIDTIKYDSAVEQTIDPILAQIKNSGQLSSAIAFDWTPNVFAFPMPLNTLQAGVTGIISYNGTPFTPPGTSPALSLPDLPSSNDIRLFAADTLFSSLFWAYYKAGSLSLTVTPGMLAEQAQLTTDFYATLIPNLYQKYPDCNMELVIDQSAAPTITFAAAYRLPPPYILTSAALLTLQPTLKPVLSAAEWTALTALENQGQTTLPPFQAALQKALTVGNYATYQAQIITAASSPTLALGTGGMPADLYTRLLNLVDLTYLTQAKFETALDNTLGSSAAQQYLTVILTAASTNVANLVHSPTLTFNVLTSGSYVEVFVIQVQETDILTGFQIAQSGSNQTIQSIYEMQGNPVVALISSAIGDVNVDDIALLWATAFSGIYAQIMQAVASTGVPLPFIQGYRFQNSLITLNPGYADLAADIQFQAAE